MEQCFIFLYVLSCPVYQTHPNGKRMKLEHTSRIWRFSFSCLTRSFSLNCSIKSTFLFRWSRWLKSFRTVPSSIDSILRGTWLWALLKINNMMPGLFQTKSLAWRDEIIRIRKKKPNVDQKIYFSAKNKFEKILCSLSFKINCSTTLFITSTLKPYKNLSYSWRNGFDHIHCLSFFFLSGEAHT